MNSNIPQPTDLKWFEKNGATVEVEWNLLPAGLGLGRWLFAHEFAFTRTYKGYRVFWLRGWLRVLGLSFGAGLFMRGEKL